MATVELIMPKLGESIMEATILKWLKQPGDFVKMDETVLEIATDKVDSEVPSTAEGVLEESYSAPLTNMPQKEQGTRNKEQEEAATKPVSITTNYAQHPADKSQTTNSNGRFYSPLVLNIAASEGVSMSELENIPGTGNEGRVTKKDILQYVSNRKVTGSGFRVTSPQEVSVVKESMQPETHNSQLVTYQGNVEIIEMDRMR